MSTLLAEALKQLNLQPGEIHQVAVDGHQVEIRVLAPAEESNFPDAFMLDIRLDVPPSAKAKIVTVLRGKPILPPPMQIDESDLAPE